MPLFPKKIRFRPPIAIIFMTFSILLLPGLALKAYSFRAPEEEGGLREKVRMIKLYTVHDGKTMNRMIGPEELQSGRGIEVEGYVTGVLVLANSEMRARVDGQSMSNIKSNGDGTYSIKYFGKVAAYEIGVTPFNTYYQKRTGDHGSPGFIEGYSLFPRVVGDAVSPNNTFQIFLESGDSDSSILIRQRGYSTLENPGRAAQPTDSPMEFQYLGEKLSKHLQSADFEARLQAIAEGIRRVERVFRTDLVGRVKILDYEKVHNAVTCEEKNDIWFYINTFLGEPVAELKTIAEHETLHLLVDRMRFAKNSTIRELFADLKGYDTLSRDRLALITRGAVPADSNDEPGSGDFFAFIDERNFIRGMKGGHSGQNVDEFCTSFLHSLMFIQNLKENLDRPLCLEEGETFYLKPKKRKAMLDAYVRTIRTFMAADQESDNATAVGTCLNACLAEAQNL